jgi:hypothetical protein
MKVRSAAQQSMQSKNRQPLFAAPLQRGHCFAAVCGVAVSIVAEGAEKGMGRPKSGSETGDKSNVRGGAEIILFGVGSIVQIR